MRECFFRRWEGVGERVVGEQVFEFTEDEARVAVDVAADGEDGDTAVFDSERERGGASVSFFLFSQGKGRWRFGFLTAWTGLTPER